MQMIKFLYPLLLLLPSICFGWTHPFWTPTDFDTRTSQEIKDDLNATIPGTYTSVDIDDIDAEINRTAARYSGGAINKTAAYACYDAAMIYYKDTDAIAGKVAVWYLDRFAEDFPYWVPENDFNGKGPHGNGNGMWTSWYHRDPEIFVHLFLAYDLLRKVDDTLVNAHSSVSTVETFLQHVINQDGNYNNAGVYWRDYIFNQSGWKGPALVACGRVMESPELVHRGIWNIMVNLYAQHSTEGLHAESWNFKRTSPTRVYYAPPLVGTSYANNKFWLEFMDGYVDPGYITPIEDIFDGSGLNGSNTYWGGNSITNALDWEDIIGRFVTRNTAALTVGWGLPDSSVPVFNEGKYFGTASSYQCSPPSASRLAGFKGRGILAYGTGTSQTQLQIGFHPKGSHGHEDALHIIWYAKGEQMLGGTSYQDCVRKWNNSVYNHNTVVVDDTHQKEGVWVNPYNDEPWTFNNTSDPLRNWRFISQSVDANHHNNLLLWEPGYKSNVDMQLICVDGLDAYRHTTATIYTRLCSLVHVTGNECYLLDMFRTSGDGEYRWHGHGGYETYTLGVTGPTLTGEGGALGAEGGVVGIEDLTTGTTSADWQATFYYPGVDATNKMWFLEGASTKVYTGNGLRPQPQGVSCDVQPEYKMLAAERTMSLSATNHFVVVNEAQEAGDSYHVQSIDALTFTGSSGGAQGVKVTLDNATTDYIIWTDDKVAPYPTRTVSSPSMSIKGNYGHVRVVSGAVSWMKLINGDELHYTTNSVQSTASDFSWSGAITNVLRIDGGDATDSFQTDTNLSSVDTNLIGKAVIATFDNGWTWGYTIASISGTQINLNEEPGWVIDGANTRTLYFPVESFTGNTPTFYIPGSAYVDEFGTLTATGPGTVNGIPPEDPPATVTNWWTTWDPMDGIKAGGPGP